MRSMRRYARTEGESPLHDNALIDQRPFPPLINDSVIRVAMGEMVERIPVWIMRQAGRYLPEFRKLREDHGFFEICESPTLACETTLMPLNRFPLDAAIIFSDILEIPKALGLEVVMEPTGPKLPHPMRIEDIDNLNSPQEALYQLSHVGDAIALTRHRLKGEVPLFGFAGAPWTLMAYMIEGGGSKTYAKAKHWLYAHENAAHRLLDVLTDTIIKYLIMQVEHGAQILQLFDSCAEYLNRDLYKKFCLPHLKKISQQVKTELNRSNTGAVPMVLFVKGGSYCLTEQAGLGYDVLQVDWTVNPEDVRGPMFAHLTIQGNLDPCALYAPKDEIERMTTEMVAAFGPRRYIANLGHGIYPDMSIEAVDTFVNAVHNFQIGG